MAGRWTRVVAGAIALLSGVVVARAGTSPAAAGTPATPWAWGALSPAQGIGQAPGQLVPVQTPAGWTFTDVAAGATQNLAIGTDGELYAWGGNGVGEVGNGTLTDVSTPVRIPFPNGARPVHVAAGNGTSAAITDDGGLWFWGYNGFGNFGLGYATDRQTTPIRSFLPGGVVARQVAVWWGYTVILGSDGRAYTAGTNWNYDLGDGTTQHRLAFVQVAIPGDARLSAVSSGMALGIDGTVYTWGPNNSGQLGTGSTAGWTDVRVAALPAGVKAKAIASMTDHRLALGTDDRIYTWGGNTRGQLGDGTTNDRWSPVPIALPGGVRPVSVHAGLAYSGAVGADGRLYGWGTNFYGNLADGTTTDRWTPVAARLPDGHSVASVSLGQSHTYALLTSGTTPPPTTTTTTAAPPPTTVPPTAPPTVPPTGTGRGAPGFVPVTPRRVLDTRDLGRPVAGGAAHVLDLAALVPVTATDVVLNVTVTEPAGPGFVTVAPCGVDRPLASNLNMVAGQTVPNLVTVSLGDDAQLCLFTSVDAHLVADLAGWYELGAGSGLVAVAPQRLFDTRHDGRPLPAGGVRELDLRGIVDADADTAVLNVTATEAGGDGYVTVYPCTATRPLASNLNVTAGRTTPNLVTVALGADQRLCFYASVGTHLLADLGGWYSPSSTVGYIGLVPERAFDTRDDLGPIPAGGTAHATFGPGPALPGAVVAVVLNVTAVDPHGAGFVTVFPCAAGLPIASNLNVTAGQTVANLVVASADDLDRICFYTHATTDLVADVAGYFTEAG